MAGNDSYTVSLLHFDGYDGSTIFTDDAFGGSHIWTANGNAQIDTAQRKLCESSGLFDGSGDYIQTPYSSDFDFGSGDFTWDFWVRWNTFPSSGNNHALITVGRIADANNLNVLYFNNTGGNYKLYFLATVGGVVKAQYNTANLSIGTSIWYHFALVRSGSSMYIFQDGVAQSLTATTPISTNSITPAVNEATTIARYGSATYDFYGWLDELRISKGIARWTSNFSSALPISGYYDMVGKLGGGRDTLIQRWHPASMWGYYTTWSSILTSPVNGVISGVVNRNGSPVANALVRLYYRPNGNLICQIKSSSDGSFSFSPASTIWTPFGAGVGLNPSDLKNYLVLAVDPQNSLNIKGYDMITSV